MKTLAEPVRFTKMHGLGNDYLFIDTREMADRDERDWGALAVQMSDRHFGVGSDGIILIAPSERAPVRMRIFNADGSESEMCGNGLRALAKWLYDRGQLGASQVIETGAGLLYPEVLETRDGRATRIRVNMGAPRLTRGAMGMEGDPEAMCMGEPLTVDGDTFTIYCVSMGNPHVMLFGPMFDVERMASVGSRIERHPAFRHRTNVHSVEVESPSRFRMRHWERGAGLTMACGTGVSAALVAAVLAQGVSREATVTVPGGELEASWDEKTGAVFLTGPAVEVCEGVFHLS